MIILLPALGIVIGPSVGIDMVNEGFLDGAFAEVMDG
jgi:hypothetical protein